jgi:hypothetical protein
MSGRVPSFIPKEIGLDLLGWPEKVWSCAVDGGFLPQPIRLTRDILRWEWADIADRVRGFQIRPNGPPTGVIYFAKADGFIKIGYTTNLSARLISLQTSSPMRINLMGVIPGNREDEKDLHAKFARLRQHGEWFLSTRRLNKWIEKLLPKRLGQFE